jgi:hypothetical protein
LKTAAAAAIFFNHFFMTASREAGASRFLPARFQAHFIFRLASRSGVVFYAGSLLIAAQFAATRLLSLCSINGLIKTDKHQQSYGKASHDEISSQC